MCKRELYKEEFINKDDSNVYQIRSNLLRVNMSVLLYGFYLYSVQFINADAHENLTIILFINTDAHEPNARNK